MTAPPRIWLLLGSRRGDNNQLLALAEGLGLPFETRTLFYRRSARAVMRLAPKSLAHVTAKSLESLQPPWPDLVIGVGRRSVPVARWIKEQSGGATRLVRVGHPRAPSDLFDLVITTHQYPVPDAPNVVRLPLAMNRFAKPPAPSKEESALLAALPRPHRLLAVGGTAPMWRLDPDALEKATATLVASLDRDGGSLIVMPSPRTPASALERVRGELGARGNALIVEKGLRFSVALADADLLFVTADSVSMISEAIATGKPVGLVPVQPDLAGRIRLGSSPGDSDLRDVRRFWRHVRSLGLVGTVAAPRHGDVDDPLALAVAAMRRHLPALFAPCPQGIVKLDRG